MPDNTDTSLSSCQSLSGRRGCRSQEEEAPVGRLSQTPTDKHVRQRRFKETANIHTHTHWCWKQSRKINNILNMVRPGLNWMNAGDFLPHRSDRKAGLGRCGVVHECTRRSDCDTSHQPPYRSAESSPGQKQTIAVTINVDRKNIKLVSESKRQSNRCCNSQSACVRGFWSLLDGGCSYLWVDAEVFSGRKGQSEEVVALSGLFAIKLHQLSQLLHDLNRRRNIRYKFWWFKAISPSYCFKLYSNCLILTLQMTEP